VSTLKAWRLRSGTLDCVHLGPTPKAAFLAAVRQHNPQGLGLICEIYENGAPQTDEGTFYLSTERILKAAGLWGDA
jgi:hypothetical protein